MKKKRQFSKYRWGIYAFCFALGLLLIGASATYNYLISKENPTNPSFDGWLGFWGGYLGSILSGTIALLVVRLQIVEERNRHKEEKNDSTFYYLYSMLDNRKYHLMKANSFQDLQQEILNQLDYQLKEKAVNYINNKKNVTIVKGFRDKLFDRLSKEKNELLESVSDSEIRRQLEIYEEKSTIDTTNWDSKYLPFYHDFESIKNRIEIVKKSNKYVNNSKWVNIKSVEDTIECYEKLGEICNSEDLDLNYKAFLKVLKDVKEKNISTLDETQRKAAIEAAFIGKTNSVGQYFKIVSTIIQFFKTNDIKKEKKNFYINSLNADMFIIEEILLFYYVEYTSDGSINKRELQSSGIFKDLKSIGYEKKADSLNFFFKEDTEKIKNYN